MLFELSNEQRKYLGLIPTEKSWELVKFNDSIYLYFDNNKLCKKIIVSESGYHEIEMDEITAENRTILLPKTSKGKPKKLNFTGLQSCNGIGVYFRFDSDIRIANYTTQTTFYSTYDNPQEYKGIDGLKNCLIGG